MVRGARKGALHMPKQFRSKKVIGQCAAIHRHHGQGRSRARHVQRPGRHFLPVPVSPVISTVQRRGPIGGWYSAPLPSPGSHLPATAPTPPPPESGPAAFPSVFSRRWPGASIAEAPSGCLGHRNNDTPHCEPTGLPGRQSYQVEKTTGAWGSAPWSTSRISSGPLPGMGPVTNMQSIFSDPSAWAAWDRVVTRLSRIRT